MVCKYLTEFSHSWNARKCVQEGSKFQEIYIFKKTSEKHLKSGKSNFDPSCTHFLAFQEGENSVRYLQTIDNQYTKRTRFPDQPFGLGDSWSAGKFTTFQALFPVLLNLAHMLN